MDIKKSPSGLSVMQPETFRRFQALTDAEDRKNKMKRVFLMGGLRWRLEIMDIEEFERTGERFHCTEVQCFFTLSDVWNFLGFRLKKERCGYSGIKNGFFYCLMRF